MYISNSNIYFNNRTTNTTQEARQDAPNSTSKSTFQLDWSLWRRQFRIIWFRKQGAKRIGNNGQIGKYKCAGQFEEKRMRSRHISRVDLAA